MNQKIPIKPDQPNPPGQPSASPDAVNIALVLISHTNTGKTTLTRTLLGADVGEVRDAAHVTLLSEAHTLLASAAGDRLQLWDTPGFGDSVRLLRRLGSSDNPIGWFLREVLDRYRDRPFWLGQQALRTARDAADVVLYLVNAAETPQDAGYLDAEMKILAWLGKPVMVLLNQVGPPRPAATEEAERALWRQALAPYPLVRTVLSLDAFARCWVHERVFYDALGTLLDPAAATGYARLSATWANNNTRRFASAMQLCTDLLATSAGAQQLMATDDQTLARRALQAVGFGKDGRQRRQDQAMQAMIARLDHDIGDTTGKLLTLHQLDPGEAAMINARVRENFVVRAPIDKAQAGLLGAVISGATTGLTAEVISGGLTAGIGALVGGIVGAFTFAGAAWGFNASTDRQAPHMTFSDDFLRTLLVASLLRYLAIIHFGRGRGQFVQSEAPAFWQEHVEQAVAAHASELMAAWQALRGARSRNRVTGPMTGTMNDPTHANLQRLLATISLQILRTLYPGVRIE